MIIINISGQMLSQQDILVMKMIINSRIGEDVCLKVHVLFEWNIHKNTWIIIIMWFVKGAIE